MIVFQGEGVVVRMLQRKSRHCFDAIPDLSKFIGSVESAELTTIKSTTSYVSASLASLRFRMPHTTRTELLHTENISPKRYL